MRNPGLDRGKGGELLARAGLRRTGVREAVLRALAGADGALSHQEIMERLKAERPDRVSVYRALDAFVAAGAVHAVEAGPGGRLFELADRCSESQCHPHFTCRICRRTSCLPEARAALVRAAGYKVERQKIYLEGVCPSCAGS
jgi:Fur family ferric uptake transcriptional regulator